MTYLRFSPADYRALCRVCRPPAPLALDVPAFTRLLVLSLSDTHPPLAERIAELDGRRLGVLYDHFRERASRAGEGAPKGLGPKERFVLGQACRCYAGAGRFLRPLKSRLVEFFKDLFPALSEKLSRMSDDQFEGLYEQATRRKRDSA